MVSPGAHTGIWGTHRGACPQRGLWGKAAPPHTSSLLIWWRGRWAANNDGAYMSQGGIESGLESQLLSHNPPGVTARGHKWGLWFSCRPRQTLVSSSSPHLLWFYTNSSCKDKNTSSWIIYTSSFVSLSKSVQFWRYFVNSDLWLLFFILWLSQWPQRIYWGNNVFK